MQPVTELYVELAERIAARLGSPRVRALHLPPGGAQESGFCALELEDGTIGFCYIHLEDAEALMRERYGARDLLDIDAMTLVRGLDGDAASRALGFAALNALSQQLFTRANWMPSENAGSLGTLNPQRGKHVGMIGLFSPLIPIIERAGARLTVLELDHTLVRQEQNYRVTLDPTELADCDQIISTCTVMLNDTLDDVLAACRKARHFAIVGPTASCVPDPLFARGVDSLGGRRVIDRKKFVAALRSGNKWGTYASKYILAHQDYPGLEWLIERALTVRSEDMYLP